MPTLHLLRYFGSEHSNTFRPGCYVTLLICLSVSNTFYPGRYVFCYSVLVATVLAAVIICGYIQKRMTKVILLCSPGGLEPTTPVITVRCSNQLSYEAYSELRAK